MRRRAYECDACRTVVPDDYLPSGWQALVASGANNDGEIKATLCSRECAHRWLDDRFDERLRS